MVDSPYFDSHKYRTLIVDIIFLSKLKNCDTQDKWFQQEDADCHIARATFFF